MKKSLLAGLDLPEINRHTRTPEPSRQPEYLRQPLPVQQEPIPQSLPDTTSHVGQTVSNQPTPKRKAGRPRLNPDHVLTTTEKTRRYQQKRKAITARVQVGAILPAEVAGLSHRDLCLIVANVLNHPDNLNLRMNGSPLIKELKQRLSRL